MFFWANAFWAAAMVAGELCGGSFFWQEQPFWDLGWKAGMGHGQTASSSWRRGKGKRERENKPKMN
jgi:hypothetical protein